MLPRLGGALPGLTAFFSESLVLRLLILTLLLPTLNTTLFPQLIDGIANKTIGCTALYCQLEY